MLFQLTYELKNIAYNNFNFKKANINNNTTNITMYKKTKQYLYKTLYTTLL